MISLKSEQELALMRQAGRIVAEVLARIEADLVPGMTTADLEAIARQVIVEKHDAVPSFKGYRGYPAMICASVNEEVVHGIPGPRRLNEGDIVGIDVGAIYRGYHGDAAITLPVGRVDENSQRLLEVTAQALQKGIDAAQAGKRTSDISRAIQECAEAQGFSVVREYTGHGIGRRMHEDPQVLNYYEPRMGSVQLRPGMTLALEPMVNAGDWLTRVLEDNWTVVTVDSKRSAHFEHTIVITKNGPEILTRL
ncbi:MAG TPA: type I methionyl aminopeptidase [Anaerolineae bacterium]|nr:type I methionyl aminopeptidase [Anaerolineae bacterium]